MTRYQELMAEYDLQREQEQEYWETLHSALKEIHGGFFSYLEPPAETVKLLTGEERYLSVYNVTRSGRKLNFTLSLLLGDPKVEIPPSSFIFRGAIHFDGKAFTISANGLPGTLTFAKDGGFDQLYPALVKEAKRQLAFRPTE